MKPNMGKKYIGLTNRPLVAKKEHGDPSDWWQFTFEREQKALNWQDLMIKKGAVQKEKQDGWRYAFSYTITSDTVEEAHWIPEAIPDAAA